MQPTIRTYYYPSGEIYEKRYVLDNDKLHRLDGPAVIEYDTFGKIFATRFYINGFYLRDLENFVVQNKLLEYIRKYPIYIKEIAILARHNNWLNEKELELLTCMDMFR